MLQPYFELTVPVFIRNLKQLTLILDKSLLFSNDTNLAETDLLNQKLADDMFPLLRQIQIITDNAKGASARLAGVTPPTMTDTETTVAELQTRIDTVVTYLGTLTPEQFIDAGTRQITLPYYPDTYILGSDYLAEFALANFFFHMNVAYAILRHGGVPLGKADYIGSLSMHPHAG